jgi:Alpha/beta hydrolase domain
VPRRINGTLVPSLPQSGVGFPTIPGVKYTGLMTTGDLFDFGPDFVHGILSFTTDGSVIKSPVVSSPYPVFVPKTDADGNEIAGVRFPDVQVPVATYTGYGLRAPAFGGDDLCDAFGQMIPFAQTKADREVTGDPRLSIEERYPTHADYVAAVTQAAQKLRRQRFMLQEDVDRAIQAAEASSIGA